MINLAPFLVILVIIACFTALMITKKEPELIFGSGLILLLILGIVSVERAFAGFSNPGLLTVACLYVLAAGIKETGLLNPLMGNLLGGIKSYSGALARLTLPVAFLSSMLNNTPIVAALIPSVSEWSKSTSWSPRLFLLPLSFAAILGGTCTLIGTSTNLLVYGLLQDSNQNLDLSFFDIGYVGLPLTLIGILYLLFFTKKILGDKALLSTTIENTKKYTVEMLVDEGSSLIGKNIEQAKLRQLKGLFLIEIIRRDLVLVAVDPKTTIEASDRLVFTGLVDSITDLLAIDGLKLAEDQVFKLGEGLSKASIVEAVIGTNHPLVGLSIRRSNFRKKYNAVIIAVLREGQRVKQKIGDIQLEPGDTLLMLAQRSFVEKYSYSKEFLLVKDGSSLPRQLSSKRIWALLITLMFVVTSALEIIKVVEAAALSALLMIVSNCINIERAKQSLDLQVILTIAIAFGLGNALTDSGGADLLAQSLVSFSGHSPVALLIATYLLTMILTELVTNNAAAVIAYSLVSGIVLALGYNIVPYAIAIMIAASASFISPLGYQTNLMVYSAGRYQFRDYLKLGIPLSLLAATLSIIIIPIVWSLN